MEKSLGFKFFFCFCFEWSMFYCVKEGSKDSKELMKIDEIINIDGKLKDMIIC